MSLILAANAHEKKKRCASVDARSRRRPYETSQMATTTLVTVLNTALSRLSNTVRRTRFTLHQTTIKFVDETPQLAQFDPPAPPQSPPRFLSSLVPHSKPYII